MDDKTIARNPRNVNRKTLFLHPKSGVVILIEHEEHARVFGQTRPTAQPLLPSLRRIGDNNPHRTILDEYRSSRRRVARHRCKTGKLDVNESGDKHDSRHDKSVEYRASHAP